MAAWLLLTPKPCFQPNTGFLLFFLDKAPWLITLSALLGGTQATSARQEGSREAASLSTLSLAQRLTMTCDAVGEQRWTFIKIDLGNNFSQTLSSRLGKFLGSGEKL